MLSCYSLNLSNNHKWNFYSTPETSAWLEKIASIINLNRCEGDDGYLSLIFIRSDINKKNTSPLQHIPRNILQNIPQSDWTYKFIGNGFTMFQFWTHQNSPFAICNIGLEQSSGFDLAMAWRTLLLLYQYEIMSGGVPIHSAFIANENIGVILPAEGNTGKSTCCRRLTYPWRCMSDDEALILIDKNGNYMAHPSPTWSQFASSDSQESWNIQEYMPLKAIFFLEQSKIDKASRISIGQASMLITKFSAPILTHSWMGMDKEERNIHKQKLIENSFKLANSVPAFLLKFTRDGQFLKEIENAVESL